MCLSSDLPSSNFIAHAAAAAELLDDAVVRNGLADHSQECYGV
jgi:hypothetical protein